MNNKFTCLYLLLATLFFSTAVSAQSVGDYISVTGGTGLWDNVASWNTWNGTAYVAAADYPGHVSTPAKIIIGNSVTITVDVNVTVNTIEVQSGSTLRINDFSSGVTGNNLTQNGGNPPDMLVDAGGTLNLGGGGTWGAGTGNPTAQINGAFNWTSGTLGIVTTTGSGSVTTINNPSTVNDKTLTANFTNNGTINWSASTGGGIFVNDNASFVASTFTNATSGIINENFTGNRGFGSATGDGIVINQGTINKNSSNELKFGVAFTNTGTIQGATTGNIGLLGVSDVGGTVTSNTGTISASNGTTAGLLTVDPLLFNSQTPTLVINIPTTGAVAGTNYDQVTSNGAINISGTNLIVNTNASDVVGTTYTILNSPSGITGTFASTTLAPSLGGLSVGGTTVTVQKINTLPLTWGSFNALAKPNGTVSLDWSTYQEENTAHFVVQYSTNGSDYNSIGTVPAAGNSHTTSQYSFVQSNPATNGNDYYRIQEVDLDGSINYSTVRVVSFKNGSLVKVVAIPNPVHDLLQLNVQGEGLRASFIDAAGRTLHAWILQNGYQQVGVQDVPAGEYQLVIYQKNQQVDAQHIIKL